jgi:5-carboxymethyl-2-hydroxymuconate isomerase
MASGEFALENLKSRAYRADHHCVADGDPGRGFVALSVRILAGRDDAVKAALAESALSVLRDAYPDSVASGRVDLSVQIVDMHRTSYRKIGMTDC